MARSCSRNGLWSQAVYMCERTPSPDDWPPPWKRCRESLGRTDRFLETCGLHRVQDRQTPRTLRYDENATPWHHVPPQKAPAYQARSFCDSAAKFTTVSTPSNASRAVSKSPMSPCTNV